MSESFREMSRLLDLSFVRVEVFSLLVHLLSVRQETEGHKLRVNTKTYLLQSVMELERLDTKEVDI